MDAPQFKENHCGSTRILLKAIIQYTSDPTLTTGRPLLMPTPSCSIMFLEMVMEGRSRLWGGNCGVKWARWALGCSGRPGKDVLPSWRPRPDSVSGGGVMGGISNSSSPRLGVWNVWMRKETEEIINNSSNFVPLVYTQNQRTLIFFFFMYQNWCNTRKTVVLGQFWQATDFRWPWGNKLNSVRSDSIQLSIVSFKSVLDLKWNGKIENFI